MAADEIQLQLPQRVGRNPHISEPAKTGADSVNDFTALENVVDQRSRPPNALARFLSQRDRLVRRRDCVKLRERDLPAGDFHKA